MMYIVININKYFYKDTTRPVLIFPGVGRQETGQASERRTEEGRETGKTGEDRYEED